MSSALRSLLLLSAVALVGCDGVATLAPELDARPVFADADPLRPDAGDSSSPAPDAESADLGLDAGDSSALDAAPYADAADVGTATVADAGPSDAGSTDTGRTPIALRVLTFNTGTTGGARHDLPPDDGYGSAQANLCDQYYGNGLSWVPVMDDTRDFLARTDPDVVVFQEIFHPEECANIPMSAYPGFYCETWSSGQPTVAQYVLGPNWQVMCNLGKPDKCAAVHRRVGTFQGCSLDFCIEGMAGGRVPNCGGGSRVGRGVIDLVDGRTVTLVNFHGSSGVTGSDQACREAQVEQVFIDLGDGQPGANGLRNLIMGDLNADPVRQALIDSSARRWGDFVGDTLAFHFISDVGRNAAPTYASFFNIDHVISDVFVGSCFVPGVTMGQPEVSMITFFDHKPIVCDIRAD